MSFVDSEERPCIRWDSTRVIGGKFCSNRTAHNMNAKVNSEVEEWKKIPCRYECVVLHSCE